MWKGTMVCITRTRVLRRVLHLRRKHYVIIRVRLPLLRTWCGYACTCTCGAHVYCTCTYVCLCMYVYMVVYHPVQLFLNTFRPHDVDQAHCLFVCPRGLFRLFFGWFLTLWCVFDGWNFSQNTTFQIHLALDEASCGKKTKYTRECLRGVSLVTHM